MYPPFTTSWMNWMDGCIRAGFLKRLWHQILNVLFISPGRLVWLLLFGSTDATLIGCSQPGVHGRWAKGPPKLAVQSRSTPRLKNRSPVVTACLNGTAETASAHRLCHRVTLRVNWLTAVTGFVALTVAGCTFAQHSRKSARFGGTLASARLNVLAALSNRGDDLRLPPRRVLLVRRALSCHGDVCGSVTDWHWLSNIACAWCSFKHSFYQISVSRKVGTFIFSQYLVFVLRVCSLNFFWGSASLTGAAVVHKVEHFDGVRKFNGSYVDTVLMSLSSFLFLVYFLSLSDNSKSSLLKRANCPRWYVGEQNFDI